MTATTITSLPNWYSTDPPAKFMGADRKPVTGIAPETDFWQKLVSFGATDIEVNTLGEEDQEGLHVVRLAISMKIATPDGPRTRYVTE